MFSERLIVISLTLILTFTSYTILCITNHEEYTKPLEIILVSLVTAITSYYLAQHYKASREAYREASNPHRLLKIMNIAHLNYNELARICYIILGIGIALLLQHAVCYMIDLELSELLFGHEWIGLYLIIISMIGLGILKKLQHSITKIITMTTLKPPE